MALGAINPMGMGSSNPLMGLGGALQLAPNLLSFGHQAPQMLTNPYMGGPFSGQGFGSPSSFMGMPMPFQAPAPQPAMPSFFPFGPQAAPAQPAMPSFFPFSPQAAPAPAQAAMPSFFPFPMPSAPAPAPAVAPAPAMPFDPMMLMNMFAPTPR
jgi:hypothetical protein